MRAPNIRSIRSTRRRREHGYTTILIRLHHLQYNPVKTLYILVPLRHFIIIGHSHRPTRDSLFILRLLPYDHLVHELHYICESRSQLSFEQKFDLRIDQIFVSSLQIICFVGDLGYWCLVNLNGTFYRNDIILTQLLQMGVHIIHLCLFLPLIQISIVNNLCSCPVKAVVSCFMVLHRVFLPHLLAWRSVIALAIVVSI